MDLRQFIYYAIGDFLAESDVESIEDVDLKILRILLQDARISYEKVAKKVKLSPTAVKNRIEKLVEQRIIQNFTAYLNPLTFNQSICFSLITVKEGTISSDFIDQVGKWKEVVGGTISLQNKISIVHHFLNSQEMHETVEKLKALQEVEEIKNYILVIPGTVSDLPSKIMKNDWRIIKALRYNCRKSDTELAAELGLSAKTINRRLAYLKSNGIVVFIIELDTSSGGLLTYELILTLKGYNSELYKKILETLKDEDNSTKKTEIFYTWRVVNAEVLIMTIKINHLSEIEDHIKKLKQLNEIIEIETYVPTRMYYFEAWYDDFVDEQMEKF